jgi:hypothetical protein
MNSLEDAYVNIAKEEEKLHGRGKEEDEYSPEKEEEFPIDTVARKSFSDDF